MTTKGYKQTKEHSKKIKDTLKRKYESGELIGSQLGKHRSEETKRRMSVSKLGDKNPAKRLDVRKKMSNNHADFSGVNSVWFGRKHTEITKQNMRKPRTEEAKQNMRKPKLENHKKNLKLIWDNYSEKEKNNRLKNFKAVRKTQIFPIKDTTIEVIIQNYLKQLNINFLTHKYMKDIEHGYQCDVLIPVQEDINKKTIIECFGTYWHNYPLSREIDIKRCNELREKGYRVLVFWENEIRVMNIEDLKEKLEELKC